MFYNIFPRYRACFITNANGSAGSSSRAGAKRVSLNCQGPMLGTNIGLAHAWYASVNGMADTR
jgi:hypothetical protein